MKKIQNLIQYQLKFQNIKKKPSNFGGFSIYIIISMKVLHFTSWLFKDIFWSLKWTWMATFMVIPTIFFTIYFLIKEKDERMENWTLFFWVMLNITWMFHEIHGWPIWIMRIFMFLGVLNSIRLMKRTFLN